MVGAPRVTALCLAALLAVCRANWSQFHGDDARDGCTSVVASQSGQVLFVANVSAPVHGSVVIGSDGTLYLTPFNSGLVALHGNSGNVLWWAQLGRGCRVCTPVVASDGTVYAGPFDGATFVAVDGASGSVKWKASLSGAGATPSLGYGLVFASDGNGAVNALDAATGTLQWSYPVGVGEGVGFALSDDGVLYACSALGSGIYALNAKTGAVLWQMLVEGSGHLRAGAALGSDGRVFFGSDAFQIEAFTADGGQGRWLYTADAFVRSSGAVCSGSSYFLSCAGTLYALSMDAGGLLWSVNIGGAGDTSTSSPVVGGDGTVYAGSGSGTVFALQSTNGSVKWSFDTGGAVSGSPAIGANGVLYVGSADGHVYAFQ